MNKICLTCDTRKRLKMCNGREGEFVYCFRAAGSISNVPNSITPFNELNELMNASWFKDSLFSYEESSLKLEPYVEHMDLLMGRFKVEEKEHPIGYVVK